MHLAWVQYQAGTNAQYNLVLVLLEQEDRFSCLETTSVGKEEIEKIRRNLAALNLMNNGDKIQWFRDNIPSYSKAYKELRKDRANVANTFELAPL